MDNGLIVDSASVRLALWLGTFALLAVLEQAWPRRSQPLNRKQRWPSNIGLVVISSLVAFLLPISALSASLWASAHDWGLFNQLSLSSWLATGLAWLLLDAAIYWQHRLMHVVPALWRLHRVHHSDTAFDTSTAVRFHPVEIVLSVLYKCGVIILLGAPLLAVFIFELLLSCVSLFNHANLRLPSDRWLRRIIVTPDQHRIHHSVFRVETDSNYANVLSIWDHLFRSYTQNPRSGHADMLIGLHEFRAAPDQKLLTLLRQPLQNPHRL